jgi:NAD(P)-dependent dehydrogenase (short-subunit alcohol dehydrogenase family)
MKLKCIKEQVVVVFGASSGIGRATALRLARRGAKVVVSARSEDGLESLVAEIGKVGGQAISVPAEVTNFEQVRAVADRAVSEFGHLDTWVHCAAVSLYAKFENTEAEEFRRVIDVNLNGQAFGAMAALPQHPARGTRGVDSCLIRRGAPRAASAVRLRRIEARRQGVSGSAPYGVEGGGHPYLRDQCHASGHQHALLQQGAH